MKYLHYLSKNSNKEVLFLLTGGSEINPASESSAAITAKLLGLQQNELAMSLTTRIMMTTKGGGMGTMYKYVILIFFFSFMRRVLYLCAFDSMIINY